MSTKQINYVGREYPTKHFGTIRVIKDLGLHKLYENINQRYRLVEIQFLNTGNVKIVKTSQLNGGLIKDNYAKTVCGIGCIGNAEKYTKMEYDIWYNMLRRCYNPESTYYNLYGGAGVVVCERWHRLDNFLDDLRKMDNYDKLMAGEKYQLDKDMLQPNKEFKIYSPETCKLVSAYANTSEIFLRNLDNKDVKYNGVYDTDCVKNKGYIARIYINGKNQNLGTFDEAIYAATYRDYIAWMYRRLDLLNHTGVTVEEALQHRRGRYNSINDIMSNLPPRNMCEIIDNTNKREMCYRVTPIERGY
jgi:hypothetical protein